MLDFKNDHDVIVYKIRLWHRAVAQKLKNEPNLLSIPLGNLKRWMDKEEAEGRKPSPCWVEWLTILKTWPLEKIIEVLEGETYETDRLQHGSPFNGVLSKEEGNLIFNLKREDIRS